MMMNVKPIKNERDFKKALERLEEIFDAKPGTAEGDELEVLSILIEKYEEETDEMESPDPVEAIKFRMDQLGISRKELANTLGYKSRVSEILNRKRKLSLKMIRSLNEKLDIPTDVLIKEY